MGEEVLVVRALCAEDLDDYVALRRAALIEAPLAFAASPEDDFASDAAALREQVQRAPDWMLFGAFRPQLIGTVGLLRRRHLKTAHKMGIWGMYVLPAHRRAGVAAALLDAAIAHARTVDGITRLELGVSAAAEEARRVYERAGFVAWGLEPDALQAGGQLVDETYLSLLLGRLDHHP